MIPLYVIITLCLAPPQHPMCSAELRIDTNKISYEECLKEIQGTLLDDHMMLCVRAQ